MKKILTSMLLAALISTPAVAGQQRQFGAEFEVKPPAPEVVSYESYAGLSELVTMICDDAINHFKGFYGSGLVAVEPLKTIGPFQAGKQSELGITIADQMMAMVNNDTFAGSRLRAAMATPAKEGKEPEAATTQRLRGVLEEVDGYLRVHINGVNNKGERLSFVANVEMSEAIYRALHTYL